MNNLDFIESYFTNELDANQAREFENRIVSDPAFAEEVAFYLSAFKISGEHSQSEKKEQFRELYQKFTTEGTLPQRKFSGLSPVRKLVYFIAAAAAVAGIIFGIYTITKPVSPQQLANEYINEHLQTLGVQMSGHSDSLQSGLNLYNEGKSSDALAQFEKIIQSDTTNFTAKRYAGLAALKLKDYDKALGWFEALETYRTLYANPALLYQALTLMERNQPGDGKKAKQLLQHVVQYNLDGKETAQEWLRKW